MGTGGDGRGECNCLSMFPGHFLSDPPYDHPRRPRGS